MTLSTRFNIFLIAILIAAAALVPGVVIAIALIAIALVPQLQPAIAIRAHTSLRVARAPSRAFDAARR